VADVRVQTEEQTPTGWAFRVVVDHDDARSTEHQVNLSWADYEFWSGGSVPPADVAAGVVHFLIRHSDAGEPPARFDAATIRRLHPSLDQRISDWLR
jgi:hypothetical protein